MTDDVEIDMSTRVFNPQVYRGFDGLGRLLGEIREVWAEWHVVPERFLDASDRVVVIETVRARGIGSGLELDTKAAAVWTLRDGRVSRIEYDFDRERALKAAGLAE
jgi:ketosteroid isomerase-like protein